MNSLAELLARPEGRTLDFKRQEVSLRNALKTLVAFANTAGGSLVIGADDDGTPLGVDDVRAQEERYASAIADGIEPPLTPDLNVVSIDGADLLVIRVPRFPGPFYLRSEGADKGVYVRLGSTNRRATASQREEMRRLASAQAYDERPCLGTTSADLDLAAVERAFQASGRTIDVSGLETLGVLVRHGDLRIPSNGGIVLFGTEAARKRFFPEARIRCARFVGTDKAEILDRLDVDANVLDALDEAVKFIRRNTRTAARIAGAVRRRDVPEYSPVALREVLANAVAHADYSQRGMPLRVQIYADRLEVENPGGWPIGFSEEDFKDGISRVRNPVIARVLHELDVIEGWGSGYERIRAESAKGGYSIPEWREIGPVLRVRFSPHADVASEPMRVVVPAHVGEEIDVGENVGVNRGVGESADVGEEIDVGENVGVFHRDDVALNDRQRWFLKHIGTGARVKANDIANRFDVTVRTAERDIAALRDAELVAFVGASKTGRYVLTEHRLIDDRSEHE